jgi:hypothetical protein
MFSRWEDGLKKILRAIQVTPEDKREIRVMGMILKSVWSVVTFGSVIMMLIPFVLLLLSDSGVIEPVELGSQLGLLCGGSVILSASLFLRFRALYQGGKPLPPPSEPSSLGEYISDEPFEHYPKQLSEDGDLLPPPSNPQDWGK